MSKRHVIYVAIQMSAHSHTKKTEMQCWGNVSPSGNNAPEMYWLSTGPHHVELKTPHQETEGSQCTVQQWIWMPLKRCLYHRRGERGSNAHSDGFWLYYKTVSLSLTSSCFFSCGVPKRVHWVGLHTISHIITLTIMSYITFVSYFYLDYALWQFTNCSIVHDSYDRIHRQLQSHRDSPERAFCSAHFNANLIILHAQQPFSRYYGKPGNRLICNAALYLCNVSHFTDEPTVVRGLFFVCVLRWKERKQGIFLVYAIVWWQGEIHFCEILSRLLALCTINLIQAGSINPGWLFRVQEESNEHFHLLWTLEQQERRKLYFLLYYAEVETFCRIFQDTEGGDCGGWWLGGNGY